MRTAKSRERGNSIVTREENLDYRNRCPYDAMGDYSVFSEPGKDGGQSSAQSNVSVKDIK